MTPSVKQSLDWMAKALVTYQPSAQKKVGKKKPKRKGKLGCQLFLIIPLF